MNILQQLYDSEINFELRSEGAAGFVEWKLGDPINGYVASGNANGLQAAAKALARAACEHFPDSSFAMRKRVA
jgi:hypothetical protein